MKKLILNKETIRNLDNDTLEKIAGGKKGNTTVGRMCFNTYCVCQ